jgi:hypothetical protein
LQLIACREHGEVNNTGSGNEPNQLEKEEPMLVSTIHKVSDPAAFWGGKLDLPNGTDLIVVMPSDDGTRGVCVFKSDSVDTVRSVVDEATAGVSKNEFYAINEGNAQGLPA